MMMQWPERKVEKYSSFKNKKFERCINKMRNLNNGINDSSLKEKDKEKLKTRLIDILKL